MKTVIIAAGMGSRLWEETYNAPKTLLPFGDSTILATIMANLNSVGIADFVIVVGYQANYIEDYVNKNFAKKYNVELVVNHDWKKGNGISVLAAEPILKGESFILSMSDHIVSPDALKRIVDADTSRNSLLVDPQVHRIFDIDDATKVLCDGNNIQDIGKTISSYNAIDCGVFKLTNRYFGKMEKALAINEESISAAIKQLIAEKDMQAVFMEPGDSWIDIDTPEAYHYCLDKFGNDK
jgi:1L-myo-inositol 1-phosphate cytidylyltransferase